MNTALTHRAIALAGVYQSAELVVQIAWEGRAEPAALEASLESLFKFEARDYLEVYGGPEGLKLGLRTLKSVFNRQQLPHTLERTRYVVNLMFLEKRLRKAPQCLDELNRALHEAARHLEQFPPTHINTLSRLGQIYQETISTLGPRIIVNGDPAILNNPDNASRIRAVLLSGIRAAVLWHQAGGNRWRMMLERNAMLDEIDSLLAAV